MVSHAGMAIWKHDETLPLADGADFRTHGRRRVRHIRLPSPRDTLQLRTVRESVLPDPGGTSPHEHVFQTGAAFKRIVSDVLRAAGNADIFQTGASPESGVPDIRISPQDHGVQIGAALKGGFLDHPADAGNADVYQAAAVHKRFFADAGDVAPDDDRAHVGAVFEG